MPLKGDTDTMSIRKTLEPIIPTAVADFYLDWHSECCKPKLRAHWGNPALSSEGEGC